METGPIKELELVQDASFTKEVSSEHALCIEIDKSSYKIGIFNIANNALVGTVSLEQNALSDLPLLSYDYGAVLGVFHSKRTFLSHQNSENENMACSKIPDLQSGNFNYTLTELSQELKSKFPQVRMFPFGANFISGAIQKNRYQSGQKLYVHVTESMIYLMHFSDNKLMMYSSEQLLEKNEAIYYISKAVELTNFNQVESKIYLSGEITEGSEIHTHISQRIKNIYLNKGFKFQKSSIALSSILKQKYFSIINTFQCA